MEKIKFKHPEDMVTFRHLLELTRVYYSIFEDANGSFGMSDGREYRLRQAPCGNEIPTFSFVTDKPVFNDKQMYAYNEIDVPEKMNVRGVRYEWAYVLEQVCEILGVKFAITGACISACAEKCEEIYGDKQS